MREKKLKLLWLDLIRISVCHKVATWELAVMTFLSKVMSKVFGVYFDATLSIVKHIDHVSHSVYLEIEELALFAISWQGKPLLSWCVLLLSVIWTIVTLWSWTLPLIIRTITKKIQNHAASLWVGRYAEIVDYPRQGRAIENSAWKRLCAGELGSGVLVDERQLSKEQRHRLEAGQKQHAFNEFVSDLISLHRSLPPRLNEHE